MPRLSVSLPKTLHHRLTTLAIQQNESLSHVINQLIQIGMHHMNEKQSPSTQPVEQHCQQLIIQMNALIKNISVEVLKFKQEDFEKLREAVVNKYQELVN